MSESNGICLHVDQLLIQLIVIQCILKGQAEGDAEGEKDQQASSSQREQGDLAIKTQMKIKLSQREKEEGRNKSSLSLW